MSLWSDPEPGSRRYIASYALVAVLALVELGIAWQAIHPDVPEDYRAYYIDHTTTCMRQPVTGAYTMGRTVNFRSGGDETAELSPCGWDDQASDGQQLLGENARLRFATGAVTGAMTLSLQLTTGDLENMVDQRVVVAANGTPVGTAIIPRAQTKTVEFAIPDGVTGDTGLLDITLDVPDAVQARAGDSNTRKRSIKLTEATLTPIDSML